MNVDVPPSPSVEIEQQGIAYPFGGFMIGGTPEALAKLQKFARDKGVLFEVVDSESVQELRLPPERSFNREFIDIFNEAQSGRLGKFTISILPRVQSLTSPK